MGFLQWTATLPLSRMVVLLSLWWLVLIEGNIVAREHDNHDYGEESCHGKPQRRKVRNLVQDRLWNSPYHATKALLSTPMNDNVAVVLLKFPNIPLPRQALLLNATLQLSFRKATEGGGGGLTALRMTTPWSEERSGGGGADQDHPLRIGVDTVPQVSFGITSFPPTNKTRVVPRDVTRDVAFWLQQEEDPLREAEANQGWAMLPLGSTSSWTLYSSDNAKKNRCPKLILWFCRSKPKKNDTDKNDDTTAPVPIDDETATVPIVPTYVPGNLTVELKDKMGRAVRMSTGMTGRPIAYSRQYIDFPNGTRSNVRFHGAPDAAAVFTEHDGTYVYTSNSEIHGGNGGVYSLKFNATTHEFIDYFPVLTGTSFNCGGGRTPWNTWITCEEAETWGRVWQVDPFGRIPQGNLTGLVERGGSYESAAYQMVKDERDGIEYPIFYITEDDEFGDLVRFVPDDDGRACYRRGQQWCTLEHGTHSYLRLNFQTRVRGVKAGSGNFTFGRREDANGNDYLMTEGIDVKDNTLYFTSKFQKRLYVLDLLTGNFTYSSTKGGAFEHEPDQVSRILGKDGQPSDILYFCEDAQLGECGVHARSADGRFYSILDGGVDYETETSGLAFSPDGTRMYVSFQFPGTIWQFWRTDGLPFGGNFLDIKYHAT